jgi:tetratricopeptide (TPR) repeat protein
VEELYSSPYIFYEKIWRKGSARMKKFILLGWSIAVLLLIVFNVQKGNQQKILYQQHEVIFEQAFQAYSNQQYESAEANLKLLNQYYPDNQEVQNLIALNEANLGNPEASLEAFQRTLAINPYLRENDLFMVNYLEATLMNGYLEDAQILLANCVTLVENGRVQDERLKLRIQEIGVALNGQ